MLSRRLACSGFNMQSLMATLLAIVLVVPAFAQRNIGEQLSTQKIGWADAQLERLRAGKIGIGGREIDTLTQSYNTVAEMVADPDLEVGQLAMTAGYTSKGDGGGNLYEIVAAATGTVDGGSFIDLTGISGQAKGLFPDQVLCPEQFGAAGNGDTDDKVALAAISNYQATSGLPIHLSDKQYGTTEPWLFDHSNVRVFGVGLRQHNTASSGIKKLAGFAGTAGIKVQHASGTGNTLYGVRVESVYVTGDSGTYREGHGFEFVECDNVTVRNCQAQYNEGWGVEYHGCWVITEDACSWRFNGVAATSGGGRHLNNTDRFCSQVWLSHGLINNNHRYAMKWTDGGDTNLRTVGCYCIGELYEEISGTLISIVDIESADRSSFFGCHFSANTSSTMPCLTIGDSAAFESVDGLNLFGCYWQHNSASTSQYAVVVSDNASDVIDDVGFYGPVARVTNSSKFLNCADVAAANAGNIKVFGTLTAANEHNDPNAVTAFVGTHGMHLGPAPGTAGTQYRLQPKDPAITSGRLYPDGSSTTKYIDFGAGTDRNLAAFANLWPRIPETAAAPTNPVEGTLAISDGTGGGFDGASGAGLYRYNGSSWVFGF